MKSQRDYRCYYTMETALMVGALVARGVDRLGYSVDPAGTR
jgi:hypothetical protein